MTLRDQVDRGYDKLIYENKGDLQDPVNYRPMSLISSVCKIMENIIIEFHLWYDNKWSIKQTPVRFSVKWFHCKPAYRNS